MLCELLEETKTHNNKPKFDRKRLTTMREDLKLIRTSLGNKKKTSELAVNLSSDIEKLVTARTVRKGPATQSRIFIIN